MHLNKILEQIKRHQSPTEAIDKLATALEKHEGSLLEKGFTILKSELAANMYEAINGPHFDEEHAHYAVEGMENEDGTKGPHWTVEETTSVANQMGINLKSEKHNKWDWFVAMNMIYSDFYKAVVAMTGSANTKYFAELAKAWLCDKDISEGKMWHYYVYIMCDDEENDYKAYERMHRDREEEYGRYARRSGRMEYANKESDYRYPYSKYYDEYERPGRNRYIVLFWMWGGWGGNGFGRGNQAETNSDFARLAAMGNQNNNTDLLMQAINGNKDAINTLSTNLNCDVKSIDNALCSIQNAIGKVGGEVGFSAERVINAVNAGDCNVIKAISDCCCTTQRSIDSVNLNLTQMNADNRLSICQQTNTLQNAITSGFNTLSSENATRFNILGAKIDAQTQIINDKFCQLEMREMQNKIDTLRDEKNALQSSALLQQQTSNIVSQIRPCPVPAYLTCNPYGCNGGLNGYGYGYPYGYGDSCCA